MYAPSVAYSNAPILYPRMASWPQQQYWYGPGYAQPHQHLHAHPAPRWEAALAPTPHPKPAARQEPDPSVFLRELLATLPQTPSHKPENSDAHGHSHEPEQPVKKPITWQRVGTKLAAAAGFFLVARLLGKLPSTNSTFKYLTSDWKEWAKVALGIASMNQVNDLFGWKPPAWLMAIQTTLFVNPAVSGFTKKMALQTLVMAPLVSAIVATTNYLNDTITQPVQEKLHIPPALTRLAVMISMMAVGIKTYPHLYRKVAETGMMGQEAKAQASKLVVGTEIVTCAKCGSNHLICMSEIGDYIGSMGNWFRGKHQETKRTS